MLNVEKILHKFRADRARQFCSGRPTQYMDADGGWKMRPLLVMLLFIVVILASVPCVGTAQAMSAFSRKYGMKCDSCHRQRIPELNDFGVAFYKNGFTLPGQDGSAKKDASAVEPQVSGKDVGSSDEGTEKPGTSRSPAHGASAPVAEEDESEEEVDGEPPPPPTVVYRLPSRDGSVYFTDNPVRKDELPAAGKKQGRHPTAKRGRVLRSARQPERTVVSVKPRMPSSDSVAVPQERFRSYEECMERSLLKGAPPASAEEIMDQLTEAEKRCSAYQSTRR